jgi:hypothetical protein
VNCHDPPLFPPYAKSGEIAPFLEETGLPYEMIPVDTSKGEQHSREFRAVNPNGKVPASIRTSRGVSILQAANARSLTCRLGLDRPRAARLEVARRTTRWFPQHSVLVLRH